MSARIAVLVGAILTTALAGCSEAEGIAAETGEVSRTAAQHGAQTDPMEIKDKDCMNDALPPGTIIQGRKQENAEQGS